MKITKLLVAVLCLTGLIAPAAAQGRKSLPTAARAIIQNTPKHVQGPKSFVFPKEFLQAGGPKTLPQISKALQRNIAQAQVASSAPIRVSSMPWSTILFQGVPEKIFLKLAAEEEAFYQEEKAEAKILSGQINRVSTQAEPNEGLLIEITDRLANIKNDYLRTMSLNLWEGGNLEALQMELAQYYSLGIPFEEAAFNYSLRHPYKRNLQTARLLHNPFINQKFKAPVEAFVNQPLISSTDKEAFVSALRNLQAEYNRIRQGAAKTPAIQMHIDFYKQTLNDLQQFIQIHHRSPKWNSADPVEQELENRIEAEIFAFCPPKSSRDPFAQYHQQLYDLWNKYQPKPWTQNQTLETFEKFLQNAPEGVRYPRSLREFRDAPLEEELLLDNLMYWYIKDPSFGHLVQQIQVKYQ